MTSDGAEYMNLLLQLLANGLVNGAVFAMLAVGFGLVWRSIRVFHIAYGALFVSSAYCFHVLVTQVGLPAFLSVVLTLAFSLATGIGVEVGFYRPFYSQRASSSVVMIASLGLLVATENIVVLIFGNELRSVPREIESPIRIGTVMLTRLQVTELVTGCIIVTVLWILIKHLRTFRALWAMGDRPELVSVLGLPLYRLRVFVFVISTAVVAIPAALVTLDIGIDPHMGMSYLLIAAVAVFIGGGDSYGGWVAGAVLLAVLQSVAIWILSASWMNLVTFGLLIVILMFRPTGLVGQERRVEEQ
jgi:branched-chain amino acid transport system permease protein